MPRPKKKPDYDAAQIMKDFMDTVAEAFGTYDDRTDSRDPGLELCNRPNPFYGKFPVIDINSIISITIYIYF